jgi:hypothetical protein
VGAAAAGGVSAASCRVPTVPLVRSAARRFWNQNLQRFRHNQFYFNDLQISDFYDNAIKEYRAFSSENRHDSLITQSALAW